MLVKIGHACGDETQGGKKENLQLFFNMVRNFYTLAHAPRIFILTFGSSCFVMIEVWGSLPHMSKLLVVNTCHSWYWNLDQLATCLQMLWNWSLEKFVPTYCLVSSVFVGVGVGCYYCCEMERSVEKLGPYELWPFYSWIYGSQSWKLFNCYMNGLDWIKVATENETQWFERFIRVGFTLYVNRRF